MRRLSNINNSLFPYLFIEFMPGQQNILTELFMELDKLIFSFIWENRGLRKVKTQQQQQQKEWRSSCLNIYQDFYGAVVIKTVWCSCRDGQIE